MVLSDRGWTSEVLGSVGASTSLHPGPGPVPTHLRASTVGTYWAPGPSRRGGGVRGLGVPEGTRQTGPTGSRGVSRRVTGLGTSVVSVSQGTVDGPRGRRERVGL